MFSRPRSLKERCTRSMEKPHIPASAETMSEYWFHKTGTKKTMSVFQISKFWFTTSCLLCAQSRLFNLLDWKVRLARYFTYYLFSFPLLICPFNYVAHVVGGSSQKARVHSRYRNYRDQFRKCTYFRYPTDNQLRNRSSGLYIGR